MLPLGVVERIDQGRIKADVPAPPPAWADKSINNLDSLVLHINYQGLKNQKSGRKQEHPNLDGMRKHHLGGQI